MASAWTPEVRALRRQLASLVKSPDDLGSPAIRRLLDRVRQLSEAESDRPRETANLTGRLPPARIFGRMALMRSLCHERPPIRDGPSVSRQPLFPLEGEAIWHALQEMGAVRQAGSGQWTPTTPPGPAALALCEALLDRLQFVHQPVIDLQTGTTVGYEAFVRGPRNTPVESPERLAQAFRSRGLLERLERRCRVAVVAQRRDFQAGEKLFLNVNLAVADQHPVVLPAGLSPRDIVLEVSAERHDDWRPDRVRVLTSWQQEGFFVVVDNLSLTDGARLLGDFLPDGIKMDRTVIADLHRYPDRQAIIAQMVRRLPGLKLGWFASGIENPAELHAVKGTGIRYGQGFLLGRPVPQLL